MATTRKKNRVTKLSCSGNNPRVSLVPIPGINLCLRNLILKFPYLQPSKNKIRGFTVPKHHTWETRHDEEDPKGLLY